MKTSLLLKTIFAILLSGVAGLTQAQSSGLVFKDAKWVSTSAQKLKKGSIYLFSDVYPGVDATVTIDSLVNGAEVTKIDDDSKGLGYTNAFQPEIKTPGGFRSAYAVFGVKFWQADTYGKSTQTPATVSNVQGTALDIDGNLGLKEFCEIDMGTGATASYSSTSLDLSILQLLLGKFRAINILGIERDGIDTTAKGNMYTVSKTNMTGFSVRYGATTILSGSDTRQFSLYMKGFVYPNQVTLPVKLVSFAAILDNSKVNLKWQTSYEKDVSHFIVERSTDGKNYTEAGVIFAMGGTNTSTDYAFTDNAANTSKAGVIYYRLRSVDIDAKSQLSEVRLIRIGKQEQQAISILTYPNPATSELRVTVPATWQGKKVSYELVSYNGQVASRKDAGNSSQTETLNISKLAPGMYIARVSCDGEVAQQKIIKQ